MVTSQKREITINIIGQRMPQLAAAGYECTAQRVEYVKPIERYSATQFYSRRVLP
jgi:hypothetical protein